MSLLEIKEQWENIDSSLRDIYSALILRKSEEGSELVRLVKNEDIVRYLGEMQCSLKIKLSYTNLLRFINYKKYWEGKIGR